MSKYNSSGYDAVSPDMYNNPPKLHYKGAAGVCIISAGLSFVIYGFQYVYPVVIAAVFYLLAKHLFNKTYDHHSWKHIMARFSFCTCCVIIIFCIIAQVIIISELLNNV